MFSRRYLLVVILTCLCSSAFTRDTEGNVTLSKVEVLNTSDTSLAVGLNTTVSLWIQFKLNTDLCNSPLVQWCGVAVQKCDTGKISNITDVYISNLTITTAPKDYGEYRVLVCGKELDQTFAIDYSGPVCRNNGTLPDANYITPPLAVYGVGKNVTLVCVFHGDIQEEDFHVCWNNSDTCLQPGARYHIDHSTALNCTSTGEIVIVNVTFNDSATYTCYAESRSIHYPHGGYQSTNLSILGVPEFIDSPRHIEGTTGNLVEFSWRVQSNEDYIKPFVLVNGTTNLSEITLDYDLKCVTHYPRTEFVDVTLVLDPASTSTDLKPGIHEIQLCVPFTADVVGASDYNQNPKCSEKTKFTLTTADGHQLMIIAFACVIIFIVIVGSVAIIAICVFVAIRHHHQDSTEREKLLKGGNSVMRYNTQRDTTTVVNPDGSSLPSVSSDAGVYMNKPGGTVEEESSSKPQSCSRRNKKCLLYTMVAKMLLTLKTCVQYSAFPQSHQFTAMSIATVM